MVFCDVLFYDDGKAGYKIIKVTIKNSVVFIATTLLFYRLVIFVVFSILLKNLLCDSATDRTIFS